MAPTPSARDIATACIVPTIQPEFLEPCQTERMSDYSQGSDWWQASDGKWYPPQEAAAAPSGGPWPSAPPLAGSYGTSGYGGGVTNSLAIASLVCGILGFVICVTSIPAVIMGHIARRQIRDSNGTQEGNGMALAGMITGYVVIGCVIAYIIVVVIVAANSSNDPDNEFGLAAALSAIRG